jgi:NitT/TauT family transport system permease protein
MSAPALRTLIVGFMVAVLEVLCRTGVIGRHTVIPPSRMVAELWALTLSGAIAPHAARTFGNVAIAFAVSVVAGIVIGVGLYALPRLRRAVDPLLATWYAMPVFVFYPLFVVLFGMGDMPIVAIGVLFAAAAMVIATLNGIERIPRVLRKTGAVMRLGPARRMLFIDLPSALPYLLTGVKLALAYAFIGVIASEFILSGVGLGHEIAFAYNNFDNRTMYALMLLLIVVVTLANALVHGWEQRTLARRGRS